MFFLKGDVFTPSFSYNLIFISKIVFPINFEVIFTPNSCVILCLQTKEKTDIVDIVEPCDVQCFEESKSFEGC